MAADRDSHISPLAPPQIYRRSDDEWGAKLFQKPHHFPPIKRRKTGKCFVYLFTLTVSLCLAVLVFATAVLRPSHPKLRLAAVHVNRLSSGKLTALAELDLRNGNFGRFRFRTGTGTVTVICRNATIGGGEIESGVVLGRKSARINAVVEMKADDYTARNSGKLVKMKWFAEVRGEVRVVKIMSTHRTSFMNCSLSLNLSSKAFQDLRCY